MKKLTKFLTSASIGISLSSVIFLIKDYVYDYAMKEHEIFTIMIAIFAPLFAVGTLLSVLLSKKIDNQKLLTFGLLFSGIFIILLTYLNIYHLQMLMPLMKTNSITLAVMWIARIMGGLTGLFIGISFGAAVKNSVLHYILLVLFAAGIFALGRFMPELISYEPVLYTAGGLSLACALLNSYIETEKKKNE